MCGFAKDTPQRYMALEIRKGRITEKQRDHTCYTQDETTVDKFIRRSPNYLGTYVGSKTSIRKRHCQLRHDEWYLERPEWYLERPE